MCVCVCVCVCARALAFMCASVHACSSAFELEMYALHSVDVSLAAMLD